MEMTLWKKRKLKIAGAVLVICLFMCAAGACSEDGGADGDGSALSVPVASDTVSSAPESSTLKEQEESNPPSETSSAESGESVSAEAGILPSAETSVPSEASTFEVHYIDVGQADAALVLCDGKSMLIDGGNVADSSLIYSYLDKLSLNHLNYIVCTHAHEDHVGGLAGALNYATVDVAYSPVTSCDSSAFENFVTCLEKQNVSITVPAAGDSFSLGSAAVNILGPIESSNDPVGNSIVLRVVYGETSFLFTGDAECDEEQDIINAGYTLGSTVLKVGHHGGATSTSEVFLDEIMPQYAVISAGTGNSYGHPTDEVLSRLRDADVKVYRTDMQGDVICTSDGAKVSFSVERNAGADTLASAGAGSIQADSAQDSGQQSESSSAATEPEASASPVPAGIDYILNTNTHKFHYPGCSSVKRMAERNKQFYTGTRDEVIDMGYDPCGRCHP